MNFRLTNLAQQDVVDLYVDGSDCFGAALADDYHAGLMALFALLGDNPLMDRLRSEFSPPVRVHAYRSHLMFYVEQDKSVLIVRVLHGHQNWQAVLA